MPNICFLFLLLPVMVTAQPANPFEKHVFGHQGRQLPYRLLKPESVSAGHRYPLILFLHGAGERGNDNEAQIKHIERLFLAPHNRQKYPCYVLAPQCPRGQTWVRHDRDGGTLTDPQVSMALVLDLLESTIRSFPVDPSRIYVTGVSMGAFGTWELLLRRPGMVAAAVPICGGGDVRAAGGISEIPVWVFHGANDTVVQPRHSREMVNALRAAGGSPRYTEYAGVAHNSWERAYQEKELLKWLFQQTNLRAVVD